MSWVAKLSGGRLWATELGAILCAHLSSFQTRQGTIKISSPVCLLNYATTSWCFESLFFNVEEPNAGDAIQSGGGIRKIRFARPGRGKSGGVRVFYLDLKAVGKTYFLACLLKNENANVTPAQKKELAKLVEQLKMEARK